MHRILRRHSEKEFEELVGKKIRFTKMAPGYMHVSTQGHTVRDDVHDEDVELSELRDDLDDPIIIDSRPAVMDTRECHQAGGISGMFHRAAYAWVMRENGEVMVCGEGSHEHVFPGMAEPSVGGHVGINNSYLEGIRHHAWFGSGVSLHPDGLIAIATLRLVHERHMEWAQFYVYPLAPGESVDVLEPPEWAHIEEYSAHGTLGRKPLRPDMILGFDALTHWWVHDRASFHRVARRALPAPGV